MQNFLLFVLFISLFLGCNQSKVNEGIIIGIEGNIEFLNPVISLGAEHAIIQNQIFETLLHIGKSNQIEANLAEIWNISEDLKEYDFRLKSNVFFHDGSRLTSESIKSSIKDYKTKNQSLFTNLFKSITIKDSLNFKLNLHEPSSSFVYLLTSPFYLLIGKENRDSTKIDFGDYVGTGPYYVHSRIDPKTIKLKKNMKYREIHNSSIQNIIIKYNLGSEESENELSEGELDILYAVSGNKIDRLKWEGKIDYLSQVPKSTIFIGFNNESKMFKNRLTRKRFRNVLELDKLVYNLNRGNAVLSNGPLPPIYDINLNMEPSFEESELYKIQKYRNDNDPMTVKFYFPKVAFTRRTIIEYLKSAFSKIGVQLEIVEFDTWKTHDAAIKSDSAELFIDTYSAEVLGDPVNFLFSMFHSQSDKNTLHYHNPRVDKLIDQAIREKNIDVRRNIYSEILDLISDDTPAIFLFHVKPHFAYRTAKIKKLVVNKYGIIQFHRSFLN